MQSVGNEIDLGTLPTNALKLGSSVGAALQRRENNDFQPDLGLRESK